MIEYFHVFDIDFNDFPFTSSNPSESIDFDTWITANIADPVDFDEWVTVNVGDGHAGNLYQVHLCTPMSIQRITNKRHCFVIDEYRGVDELIQSMNAFIEERIGRKPGDPYYLLSKHWAWEYEGMHTRGG